MSIYEEVKTSINLRRAAERYGINVNARGMALCPFHNDRHPSLFIADDHYHCYACGAHGDAVDFVARLYHLPPMEAAEKLLADHGIRSGKFVTPPKPQEDPPEKVCRELLWDLELRLRKQKQNTAPTAMDHPISQEYADNCKMYNYVIALGDLLLDGTEAQKKKLMAYMSDGLMERFRAALEKEVIAYGDIF